MSAVARRPRRAAVLLAVAGLLIAQLCGATAAQAAPDPTPQDPTAILAGFSDFWTAQPDSTNHFAGTVGTDPEDAAVLAWSDELVTWINNHATPAQQFDALQTSLYGSSPASYDESIALGRALGSNLEQFYVTGRQTAALPLTDALLSSTAGSSGDDVHVSVAKDTYNYPRPFLATDLAHPPAGEPCATADNSTALVGNRLGRPYADSFGNLAITPVAPQVDSTHEFTTGEPTLDPGYAGLCTAGSFPSGHTTSAYEAGITLATLLPELAPEILTRASEEGNNRMVLGVHYPLDIMGGRIGAEAGIAAQWSDPAYVSTVLEPARAELVAYLTTQCGTTTLTACIAKPGNTPYSDDPYGGLQIPGGTDQVVTDRASAVAVYTQRLSYGFPQPNATGLAPSVPAGAENLLLTTFPTLSDAQRVSVLAQTEIASGDPLDETGPDGSWQRLDLAAAMSATVQLNSDATVTVLADGGQAQVVNAPVATTTLPTSTATTSTATTSTLSTGTLTTSTLTPTPLTSAVTTVRTSPTTRTTPVDRSSSSAAVLPTTTTTSAPVLAATGTDPALPAAAGVLALLLGSGVLVLARRRRLH